MKDCRAIARLMRWPGMFLCPLLLSASLAIAQTPVNLSVIEVAPWGYLDAARRPRGILVDLAAALAREADMAPQISIKPYARTILDMAAGHSLFCFMLPDAAIDKVAIRDLAVYELELLLITAQQRKLNSADELRGHSIATLAGTPSQAIFERGYGAAYMSSVKSAEQQLLMLHYGRVDGILGFRETTEYAHQLLSGKKIYLGQLNQLPIAHLQAHLYISNQGWNADVQNRLHLALGRLIERGDVQRIWGNYLPKAMVPVAAKGKH
jgi:ABC-type amino acid transport substrate-binding protein